MFGPDRLLVLLHRISMTWIIALGNQCVRWWRIEGRHMLEPEFQEASNEERLGRQ